MNAPNPEFSRIISVARIPAKGVVEILEAKPAERTALAQRFDLIDLPLLKAELTLTPDTRDMIVATGTISADIVQRCVVTLEPLPSHLEIPIDVTFLPEGQTGSGENALDLDNLDEEFEFFSAGKIDIGEMVAQQVGVMMDPYPRKADSTPISVEFGAKAEKANPFSLLATAVKDRKNNEKPQD